MNAMFEVVQMMDDVMGIDTKGATTEKERAMFRLYVAIMKMETAEQAVHFTHEAIEMHGGNGYIEDFVTPRLLRDAQVLTVWEGTANILGLEVHRLIQKYEIDLIFAVEMSERLDKMKNGAKTLGEMSNWIDMLMDEIKKMTERINKIKDQSYNLQTYYCKNVARWMVHIFESVVAIETAMENNEREKSVAEIYLQSVWKQDEISKDPAPWEKYHAVVEEI